LRRTPIERKKRRKEVKNGKNPVPGFLNSPIPNLTLAQQIIIDKAIKQMLII
jgi:hypothetical protein